MKDYQRIITNPLQFLSTDHFEIRQKLNEHAVLHLRGIIEDQNEESYLELLDQDTWLQIEAEDSDEKRETLFLGLVTSFQLEHMGTDTILTVECMSGTCLLDVKPHLRTFQSNQKTDWDIIKYINRQYPDVKAVIGRQGAAAVDGLVLQYYETDWEFLKRLSGRMGICLNVPCYLEGCRYYWGMPVLDEYEAPEDAKYIVIKDMGDYVRKRAAGIPLSANDSMYWQLESRDIYRLGDSIRLAGQNLYAVRIVTRYHKGECIHTYDLRTFKSLTSFRTPCHNFAGASIPANITAVEQDRVQIKIPREENHETDNVKWFPYSTVYSSPDGTGWYCMPEVGDEVRLHMPSGQEEEAYIISAVHLQNEVSRQNPDHKSVKNKYGKEIRFTPETLVLTNNNGLRIELLDNQGILIESSKAVQIRSADQMLISSDQSSVTIAGTDQVVVQQGGTSLILSEDISFVGGEFRMQ